MSQGYKDSFERGQNQFQGLLLQIEGTFVCATAYHNGLRGSHIFLQ